MSTAPPADHSCLGFTRRATTIRSNIPVQQQEVTHGPTRGKDRDRHWCRYGPGLLNCTPPRARGRKGFAVDVSGAEQQTAADVKRLLDETGQRFARLDVLCNVVDVAG